MAIETDQLKNSDEQSETARETGNRLLADAFQAPPEAANQQSKEVSKSGESQLSKALDKDLHSVSRDLNAKPEDVWKAIGKFDALPWHPALESGKVTTDEKGVSTRTLVAKGGSPVFVEQLLDKGPNYITYKMLSGLPLQPEGTLRVEPNAHGGTRITWEAKIDGKDAKTVEAVTNGVMGFYAAGLDALVQKFKK